MTDNPKTVINGEEYEVISSKPTVEPAPEEAPIPVEASMEICKCVKCRIKRFHQVRALGFLPKKPLSRIAGKHEYLRLDDANDQYWTKIKHKFELEPIVDFGTCKVCDIKVSAEDFENGTVPFCKVFTVPSQLDIKLTELKGAGRKVVGTWKEWGGWTVKMMAPKEEITA